LPTTGEATAVESARTCRNRKGGSQVQILPLDQCLADNTTITGTDCGTVLLTLTDKLPRHRGAADGARAETRFRHVWAKCVRGFLSKHQAELHFLIDISKIGSANDPAVTANPYRFLPALSSSTDGYPRFLSAISIPCMTRSWILQRSLKAVSRNAS
jgi:hypothetical protein